MKRVGLLVAGLVAMLMGAVVLSRWLVSDVEPPAAPPTVPEAHTARLAGTKTPLPDAVRPVEQGPTPTGSPGTPPPVDATHGLMPAPGSAGTAPSPNDPKEPPLPEGESPWAEPSREIDYAYELLSRPDAGRAEWGNAAETFERCLKSNPAQPRCRTGIAKAMALVNGETWVDSVDPNIPPYHRGPERPAQLEEVPKLEPGAKPLFPKR